MFLTLYIMILILTLFISKLRYKTIVKLNVLFTGMWCVAAGISTLGLYDIFKPSSTIHLYSITAIITFNAVFLFNNRIPKSYTSNKAIRGSLRYKLIYFLNILSWIYLSRFLVRAIRIIRIFGLRGLRGYAFNSSMGLATTAELLIIQWIVHSIFVATMIVAVVYIVLGFKKSKLTIISIIDVVLYTLLFGGRYLIVRFIMYYFFAFLIVKAIDFEKIKKKKLNVLLLGFAILMLILITSQREWGDSNFIENAIVYYIGPFTFLDSLLAETKWIPSHLYGMGMFGFIINLAIAPLAIIFNIPYKGSDHIITQITSIMKYISPTQSYNAMTTMLYPFILDFGYFGIIFGTSFLALTCSFIEKKFLQTKKLQLLCLYVFLSFVIFDSIMSYQFLFPSSAITIGLLLFFTNNNSSSEISETWKVSQ